MDNINSPLKTCSNRKCSARFHKSCWEKYLLINQLYKSTCKMCYNGRISIVNKDMRSCPDSSEVEVCSCLFNFFH